MTLVTITIPMEYNALTRASDMLNGMAIDLSKNVDDKKPSINDGTKSHIEYQHDIDNPDLSLINEVVDSVDLDSTGLPYDARIHTAGKIKKTKKDGKWKLARNIDPKLVETVESELRAAMLASPAKPVIVKNPIDNVEYSVDDASHIPESDIVNPPIFSIDNVEYTAQQLYDNGWNDDQMKQYLIIKKPVIKKSMTFPELMSKITPLLSSGAITQDSLLKAVNKAGLASVPLLASRPDLISHVHDELFSL